MKINDEEAKIIDDYTQEVSYVQKKVLFSSIASVPQLLTPDNQVGKGGFADVFKTTIKGGGEVALKQGLRNNDYYSEKNIHSVLDHPNIIRLMGYIEDKTHVYVYLVLELAQMNLTEFLESHVGEQRDRTVCEQFANDIVTGVSYMHSEKILHGDLRGPNILIVPQPDGTCTAKIADFNMSKRIKKEIELKADIFNLSALMWILSTKKESRCELGVTMEFMDMSLKREGLIRCGLAETHRFRPDIKEFVEEFAKSKPKI